MRFPEFGGEWEEKLLGEVCTINSGKDYKHLIDGDIPVYGSGGFMTHVNDYLYDGDSVGIGRKGTIDSPVLLQGKFWTVDTLFYTSDFIEVTPRFLYYIFKNINWKKYNEASGVPSLSKSTLNHIKISLPFQREQLKIAELLLLIDQRIDTQIKIIEELERLKKGLQNKMLLPMKNFEPTFRLLAYKDRWTKIRLDEICSFYSGGTPTSSMKDLYQGSIPFIRSGEIAKNKTELYVSERALVVSSAKMVNEGDLLLALYGATSGEIAISKIKGAINQAVLCIRTRYSKLFLKYLWEANVDRILKTYLQGGQGNLSGHIVQNINFFFPTLEEQNHIANFIKSIVDKIQLEKEQLEEYKKQKNFLLQNLFI